MHSHRKEGMCVNSPTRHRKRKLRVHVWTKLRTFFSVVMRCCHHTVDYANLLADHSGASRFRGQFTLNSRLLMNGLPSLSLPLSIACGFQRVRAAAGDLVDFPPACLSFLSPTHFQTLVFSIVSGTIFTDTQYDAQILFLWPPRNPAVKCPFHFSPRTGPACPDPDTVCARARRLR